MLTALTVGGALVAVAALLIAAAVWRIENPHVEARSGRACPACAGTRREIFGLNVIRCSRCGGTGARE